MVFSFSASGWCEKPQEDVTLGEIVVEGEQEKGILKIKTTQPNTETTINKEGITLYGGAGQINPRKIIDILPSVNYQSADAYGLTTNQGIRIRGQRQVFSSVEGLGLISVGLGGPGVNDNWLFDMENMSAVSLYKGAVAPEKSLAWTNLGGTIDRSILRPADKIGFTLNESHGTWDFNKIFTRFDSGPLPWKTKMFASFSRTQSDKWKGKGDFEADIFSFGLTQEFPAKVKVELFGTHSSPDLHNYRALTYPQAEDLSVYRRYDYNRHLTGSSKEDIHYYDYNRKHFTTYSLFSNIEIRTPGSGRLLFKPYYSREKGYNMAGTKNILGGPGIRYWPIDHDEYGIVAQYDTPFIYDTELTFGYWYGNHEPPPPPNAWKAYRVINKQLVYAGWALLARPTHHNEYYSPYMTAGKQIGKFYVRGGLRHIDQKLQAYNRYDATGIPDVSYENALKYGTYDPAGSIHSRSLRTWLPNAGLSYAVSPQLNMYFNYGKSAGSPSIGLWNTYTTYKTVFESKGITAQYLWDAVKMPITDHFDLGARYHTDTWSVTGTLFYAVENDKAVNVADPNLGGVKYSQNIAKATSYGVELEISKNLTENLNVFSTASYNQFQFTKNIRVASNSVTEAKGNQVPDVPVFQGRIGATYRFSGLAVSPILRYTGHRYGDVENKERISSYMLVDADIRYTKENIRFFKSMSAGISLYNLFKKKYVSVINASDDTREGSASYYAGAPFSVVGRIDLKF